MKLGARIRKIRMFRNITQKELGRRLGYGESSADVRIAQYESGQRTPKQETLIRIAEILEVDVRNFLSPGIATMDELMETLFWMDEENRGLFHLFLLNDSESETVIPCMTVMTMVTVFLGYSLARAVTVMPPFFYPKPQGVG